MSTDYETALLAWREKRLAALTAEDGWLNVIGRDWLSKPETTIGSAEDNDFQLTVGPAHLGTLVIADGAPVSFVRAAGGEAEALVAANGQPPRIKVDGILLEVTTLNGRHAVRARDIDAPERVEFKGLRNFPIVPDWAITADWEVLPEPLVMEVDTVAGIPTEVTVTHQAVFTHDGQRVALLPTHGTPEKPQFVFRDLTSRGETYGACRFLYGEAITETTIVLDFNKAFSPPCAFTPHAVCPLPPPQNVLGFRIEAGELDPH